jgi:hypothetical protein
MPKIGACALTNEAGCMPDYDECLETEKQHIANSLGAVQRAFTGEH